jgi:hypothetical protein
MEAFQIVNFQKLNSYFNNFIIYVGNSINHGGGLFKFITLKRNDQKSKTNNFKLNN